MEKVETKTRQIEDRTHYFYCDDCDVELGHSHEYDDGYYEEFGEFEFHWYTPNGWYKLEKCLCHTCKEKYLSAIYGGLETAGFKFDKY
jgi:hypothetical protein